jgi:hypothetical protein
MLEVVIHGARRLQPASEQAISNKLSLISVSLHVEFCLAKTRANLGKSASHGDIPEIESPTTDFEKKLELRKGEAQQFVPLPVLKEAAINEDRFVLAVKACCGRELEAKILPRWGSSLLPPSSLNLKWRQSCRA